KRKDLFSSGVTIGKDILGSNANTLFFAFIGGYLALLLWFKDLSYSFGQIVNSKIFASELMMIFFAGIGIALVVPIAAFINAYYLTKTKKQLIKNNLSLRLLAILLSRFHAVINKKENL